MRVNLYASESMHLLGLFALASGSFSAVVPTCLNLVTTSVSNTPLLQMSSVKTIRQCRLKW